ncbi:hypothetical protein ABKN59_010758 [Abortiporus biennis]
MPTAYTKVNLIDLTNLPSGISLFSLPDDVLLLVISFLGVKDILQLRQTSKRLYLMTKLRWVWSNAMKRQVIDKGLPVPASVDADLKEISAQHLEARAVHAAKFHENWYSSRPTPRRSIEFAAEVPFPDSVTFSENHPPKFVVRQVRFLPGRNGEVIVTSVNRFVTCWEVPLDGSGAYRIAEWQAPRSVEQLLVNEDPRHPVQLACMTGDTTGNHVSLIHTLVLDTFHGTLTEHATLRSFREISIPIYAFRGDWIAFGNPLLVWCIATLKASPEMKDLPSATKEGNTLIRRVPAHPANEDTTKVLKVKLLDNFMLVVRSQSIQMVEYDHPDGVTQKMNGFRSMEYPAREAVVVARPPKDNESICQWPITLLVRCTDEGFDTIRQYDLLPNPKVSSDPSEFPCLFPTQYTRVTQNVTSRHTMYPARCIVGFDVMEDGKSEADEADQGQVSGANALHICEQEIYSRRCDMSEIICRKYSLTAADLEDTVGRVAIGDRHGKIEVLDLV